jgi:hypothetical protein
MTVGAFQETTVWDTLFQPNHTYLLDGDKVLAYIKQGATDTFFFTSPWRIDKRGRKFQKLPINPFIIQQTVSNLVEVKGSKGATYYIDPIARSCSCPGFTFSGHCKHIESI